MHQTLSYYEYVKELLSTNNNKELKQPSNLEAEQALLGSILVNNDVIDEISTIVNHDTNIIRMYNFGGSFDFDIVPGLLFLFFFLTTEFVFFFFNDGCNTNNFIFLQI